MKTKSLSILLLFFTMMAQSQAIQPTTYCNPLDLDYTYMVYNAHQGLSYRSGADPAVVEFQNEYYMFVTRSMGYWHSKDMLDWEFITPQQWYFEGSNAPAAFNYKDSVLYVLGNPSGSSSMLYSSDPKNGTWQAVPSIIRRVVDPALFMDDDGQTYLYTGSSNVHPLYVRTLDKENLFKPSEPMELFGLDEENHGWERFGDNHQHPTLYDGYMEGAWMTKYNGKYYLQYAAPGTEFNVYGDGVYIGESPTGPFTYAANNPIAYKPGGFANGTGHGSTVIGPHQQYWHFGTMALSVNVNWERRITMYPTYFDTDGMMHTDTYFGDFPRYAPTHPTKAGQFKGWMLLSYDRKAAASSSAEFHEAMKATDENVKTFWMANSNGKKEWLQIDLGELSTVHALQINYHDYESELYGRPSNMYHRYKILGSVDGVKWEVLIDQSNSYRDTPNAYNELPIPKKVRYVKYQNLSIPTPNLAISDFRVFGKGAGNVAKKVKNFEVQRAKDTREALITWDAQEDAIGYNILWGIAPDKMYSSWLVYGDNRLTLRSLNKNQTYYFRIEAFNENGVSEQSKTIKQ